MRPADPRALTARVVDRWRGSRTWARSAEDRGPFVLGLAVAVLVAGAPAALTTYAGLDPSWGLALNVARDEGLQFGRDFVFTYGPWGYLDHPAPVDQSRFLFATVYSIVVIGALFAATHVALRRRWELSPALAAAGAAGVAAVVGTVVERSATALAATGLVALLHVVSSAEREAAGEAVRRRAVSVTPVVLAAAAGLLAQVKLSVGVGAAVVAVLAALGTLSWRRSLVDAVAAGAAFLVSFLVWWLLAGQSLGWLPEWVRGSVEIVRGYPDAMAAERMDSFFGYLVAALMGLFVLFQCFRLARRVGLRRAVVPTLIALALGELAFKAAFIRHDDHELIFFVLAVVVLLALAPLARHRGAAVVALAAALVMVVPGTSWLDLKQAREKWRVAAQIALWSGSADEYDAQSRELGRATYALPEEFVTAIADRPVWVDPYEAGVAIDYFMNWHPTPVVQAYSAYTPFLDRLNARRARTAPADQAVLRYPTTAVDDRNPHWETPEYVLTLACRYTQTLTNGSWSLLAHDGAGCEARQPVGTVEVGEDEEVPVPAAGPDEMVVASFTPDGDNLLQKLEKAFLKDRHNLFISADGQSFRVPAGFAGSPLLVAYPDRGEEGIYPAFRYEQLSFNEPGTVVFSTIALR